MLCTPLGLDVTAPQAYALVGVAGMLAALCQVGNTAAGHTFHLQQDCTEQVCVMTGALAPLDSSRCI